MSQPASEAATASSAIRPWKTTRSAIPRSSARARISSSVSPRPYRWSSTASSGRSLGHDRDRIDHVGEAVERGQGPRVGQAERAVGHERASRVGVGVEASQHRSVADHAELPLRDARARCAARGAPGSRTGRGRRSPSRRAPPRSGRRSSAGSTPRASASGRTRASPRAGPGAAGSPPGGGAAPRRRGSRAGRGPGPWRSGGAGGRGPGRMRREPGRPSTRRGTSRSAIPGGAARRGG